MAQHLQTIDTGHFNVRNHQIVDILLYGFKRFFAIFSSVLSNS